MTWLSRRHTLTLLLATAVALASTATPIHAQDGGYIVEPSAGSYLDVKIQPGDQKIVATGVLGSGNSASPATTRPAIRTSPTGRGAWRPPTSARTRPRTSWRSSRTARPLWPGL